MVQEECDVTCGYKHQHTWKCQKHMLVYIIRGLCYIIRFHTFYRPRRPLGRVKV
jgi:hypothetical protein